MKTLISKDLKKRIYFAGLRVTKNIIHKFNKPVKNPAILFITGCQRSGTTLMYEIFQKDLRAAVYPEFSKLSDPNDPEKLRLLPLDQVKSIFDKSNTELIISKPLVESQNLDKLLNYFSGAKALWMYRDYKSVAKSNIKHFGKDNGVKDLAPIAERINNNWRSERISGNVHKIIKKYFAKNMNPYDAAALFWFARNSLFFELGLDKREDVMLFSYEELVNQPGPMIKHVYQFVGKNYPGDRLTNDIHSEAVSRGKSIDLNNEIDEICGILYSKLLQVKVKQDENIRYILMNKTLQSSHYSPD